MNIVETSVKPNARRTSYGIEIRCGSFTFNEWGLHETQAKEVHDLLILNGNEPVTLGPVTFSRRAPSELSAALATMKASIKPAVVESQG